jgi:hypothetical protein
MSPSRITNLSHKIKPINKVTPQHSLVNHSQNFQNNQLNSISTGINKSVAQGPIKNNAQVGLNSVLQDEEDESN